MRYSALKTACTLAWLALAAGFLAVTVYYIVFHHVSPLSRDQWHMYHALFEEGLWRTSITTVSGHRHILAFLLYEIDLTFFNGNNHFLIAIDWLLNLGLITFICYLIQVCVKDPLSRKMLMAWVILLLCWLLNIALLGWGFNGINNYLSIVNTVLSIFFLHRSVHSPLQQSRNVFMAVLLGGVATLSFGNGILVWPIGLISLYFWRAPRQFALIFLVGMSLFLTLYLLLPGGGAVGEALHGNGWNTLLFPLQLMGGPLYHLLRAWRLLPDDILVSLATGWGLLVCLLSAFSLWHRFQRRGAVDGLDALALTLMLIGFGTVCLLMLTRVEGVLDPAVDRFQIWALLVWLGLSLLLYRSAAAASQRRWHLLIVMFPLLAMPAQLDWGARLAEYRTRVDNALLAYQVYLPVAEDAEKALHWNWQNKLPHLFPVLENMRGRSGNVFTDGSANWLGKTLPAVTDLPGCHWSVLREEVVPADGLLDVAGIAGAERYKVPAITASQPVGWRWYAHMDEPDWDSGLVLDDAGVVRGLFHPVRNSLLPRFSGVRHDEYNAYGVARTERPVALLVILSHRQPLCKAGIK